MQTVFRDLEFRCDRYASRVRPLYVHELRKTISPQETRACPIPFKIVSNRKKKNKKIFSILKNIETIAENRLRIRLNPNPSSRRVLGLHLEH